MQLCLESVGPALGSGLDSAGGHKNHPEHLMQRSQRFIWYCLPRNPAVSMMAIMALDCSVRRLDGAGYSGDFLEAAALHIVVASMDCNENVCGINFRLYSQNRCVAILSPGKAIKN